MPKPENSLVRIVQWLAVIFGLIMAGFGVWIWWTGGRQDVAGALGGVFIFGGLAIAERMKERDRIDGLILGGTELPLIMRDEHSGIPFLDTTRIHVERIVEELLS